MWERMALPEVLNFREGPGILAKDFRSAGVPLIRLAGLKGRSVVEGCNFLDAADVTKRWSQFRLRMGDALLSTSASLGEVAVVDPAGAGAVPYTGIISFRPKDSRVASNFIPWMLKEQSFKHQIEAMGVGSVMKHFGPSHLRHMSVTVPPRPEQEAIAEVLGALDDKIAANTALAATAEQLLRAEIDAMWLTSEDRSSMLSDFVELNPKMAIRRGASAVYIDMKRLPETGWSINGHDYREPKGGARFQNGDTLLARITPCLENRKTGFVDRLQHGQVGIGSTEFIVLRPRDGVAAPIPFLLATAPRFRDHAIQHMVGTSGRQRVAASDLASFEMPKPEPQWLADFSSRAVAIFEATAVQATENSTLAETRDALLPQLMSGKLRVRDAHAAASEAGA